MDFLSTLLRYWHEITAWGALIDLVLVVVTMGWILTIKKDSTSALAWCLLVLLLPLVGMILFYLLGYQHVHRPLSRKARHRTLFRRKYQPQLPSIATPGDPPADVDVPLPELARLAQHLDSFPLTTGNEMKLYFEGVSAQADKLAAIRAARHHIHVEYFIIQPDDTGHEFLDLLAEKARAGVEVRLIYDAMGSRRLHRHSLAKLREAGGKASAFLPLDPLRRRMQVNLRNHRKILVVDGQVAHTGGLNVGDEYLGKDPAFGFWRDTDLRLRGPAVAALQRVFIEDWDFTAGEHLHGEAYLPHAARHEGGSTIQVIQAGPDQAHNSIREIYFAAILAAKQRLWIASPYFVPDAGIYDALCLAARLGVDVRLLCQFHPDKWIPFYAARYYFGDVLHAGMKVYQYTKGMMHSKVMLVDGRWASVGTANLDNRSMHLNFEVNCLIHSPEKIAELEEAFRRDLEVSIRLERDVFAQRSFAGRLIENACRLASPVL